MYNLTNLTGVPEFPVWNFTNLTLPQLNITEQIEWAKNLTDPQNPGLLMPVQWLFNQAGDFAYLSVILLTAMVAYVKSKGNPAAVCFVVLLLSVLMFPLLSSFAKLMAFWICVVSFAGLLFILYIRRQG